MDKDENSAYWDKRADSFNCATLTPGSYPHTFLKLANIPPGSHVFDMGCATGTFAIPLAQEGCTVEACDFSPRMLEILEGKARDLGITSINTHLLAWEDDWAAKGVEPKCCEYAIASRSISSDEIEECIDKIGSVATKRAIITVPTGAVLIVDPHLVEFLGRSMPDVDPRADALGVLEKRGIVPEVADIPHIRLRNADDYDYAVSELAKMAGSEPLTEEEMSKVEEYARQHFVREDGPDGPIWHLDYSLTVHWAFISWEPPRV